MTFFETITAAIADIEKYGYDSQDRLDKWIQQILQAARITMQPSARVEEELIRVFNTTYGRMLKGGQLLKVHPGISAYRLELIKPKLHAELQRRLMSSAQLIKLNREDVINSTIQRFSGWATSVPVGGSKVTDTREVKESVAKALKSLPFAERRVMIDQSHKFTSTLHNIVAVDGGAIAAEWNSHFRQSGYDYREDHKLRDSKVYAIRGNWAMEKGLMNKGAGYTDEMTAPGEEIFCRCSMTYIYSIRRLPKEMLTIKGLKQLES
jgi:hypothetical protein